MATRDSTLFKKLHTDKFLGDARDQGGRVVPIPFEHMVVTGEVSGDIVNLAVLPANCEVVGYEFVTDGVGGTNTTLEVGDAADPNRLMIALDIDTAETQGRIAMAGLRFRPTTATTVIGTWGVSNPVAGKIFRGVILIVPGA